MTNLFLVSLFIFGLSSQSLGLERAGLNLGLQYSQNSKKALNEDTSVSLFVDHELENSSLVYIGVQKKLFVRAAYERASVSDDSGNLQVTNLYQYFKVMLQTESSFESEDFKGAGHLFAAGFDLLQNTVTTHVGNAKMVEKGTLAAGLSLRAGFYQEYDLGWKEKLQLVLASQIRQMIYQSDRFDDSIQTEFVFGF